MFSYCKKYFNFLIFLFLSTLNTFGTTYYIKSTGNNSNSGTSIANAWLGISKINTTTFVAGDSILFEANTTFNGSIYIAPSSYGTTKKPIFFGSYGNGKAKIYSGNSDGFFAYNNGGFILDNLIFEGSGYTTNTGYGVYFFMDLTGNKKLDYIVLRNLEIQGYLRAGIQILSWPTDASRSGYSNIKLNNCVAHHNGLAGIAMAGYYKLTDTLYSHKNMEITHCIAHHNDGLSGQNNHTGNGIIIGQVDSCVMAFCEAYENGKNSDFPNAGPAGIWAWDSKHVRIEYCYSHHNRSKTVDGDGFDLDGGVQNSIMQYNYAHDNDGPGILIAQFTGARKMKNNIVRYNISERDGKGLGMLIWSGDPAGTITTEKIDVYNNTIYVDTIGNSLANAAMAVYNNYGAVKDIRICNNIFLAKNGANLVDLNKCLNLKFYNNSYYDFGNGYKFKDNATTYSSIITWRTATNQEIYNGKNVGYRINPNLINAGKAGAVLNADSIRTISAYRFRTISGLIGKGIFIDTLLGIQNLTKDFFGDTVNFSKQYSIGAHEILLPKPLFNVKNNCVNKSFTFENLSENSTAYEWNFGDGNTSKSKLPNHIYKIAGSYTVTLKVWGKYGYMDSLKKTVQVYELPKANFSASNVCLNDSLSILNSSTNSTQYKWYFGNGDSSVKIFNKLRYKLSGNYKIKLQVSNQSLCFDTIEKAIVVYNMPKANFSADNVCLNDSVSLLDSSINALSVKWDLSTGDSINNQRNPKFLFKNSGNYPIKLTTISADGCMDSITKKVEVYSKPKANFTSNTVCLNTPTIFTNLSTDSCTYSWFLTTKDSSSLKNTQYTFAKNGNYSVRLNVKNKFNCKDSIIQTVVVKALPSATFTVIKKGSLFSFKPIDSLKKQYYWQLKDTVAYSTQLEYKARQDGNFTVKLMVTDSSGCDSTNELIIPYQKVSVKSLNNPLNLSATPNPFSGNLNVTYFLPNNQEISITIIDNLGREISIQNNDYQMAGQHQFLLNANYFPNAGIYILRFNIGGQLNFLKVVKN